MQGEPSNIIDLFLECLYDNSNFVYVINKDKLLERDEELEYLKRVHEDLKDLYRKTAAEKSATLVRCQVYLHP